MRTMGIVVEMLIMIGVPIALTVVAQRHRHIPLRVFFIASGCYLANLVVNVPLTVFLWPRLFSGNPIEILIATTLTYGVCEEIARYLSFRIGATMRSYRTPDGALAAGVGHGGTESIVFAGQYLVQLFAILSMNSIPRGAWWQYVLTGLERLPAIAVHLGFAVLIVLAYRKARWFLPLAIGAHFLVDLTTMGLARFGFGLASDLLFVAYGLLALFLVTRFRRSVKIPTKDNTKAGFLGS